MVIKDEQSIIQLIEEDTWMMDIIRAAQSMNLPDWWVCAGFVRSKIWDTLHGYHERTEMPDVDVIFFDNSNINEAEEKRLENQLRKLLPNVPWSVKNQARMHTVNNIPPYSSSADAISKFPETATALGVKLNQNNQVILMSPCGIDDLINLEIKPTVFFKEKKERADIYEARIIKKDWKSKWPKVVVHHSTI